MGRDRIEQHKLDHKLHQQQLWAERAQAAAAERAAADARRAAEFERDHQPHPLEPVDTFPPVPAGLQAIDILSVNDMHRQLEPVHYADTGGAARLVGTVRQLLKEYPSAIVVNLGDLAYDTTNMSGAKQFEPTPQLLKAMHTGILELGNHEFQDPTGQYASLKQGLLSKFDGDVLCANVVQADHQPFPSVKPYTIKQLLGYNVAFIGVCTQDMATQAHPAVAAGLAVADIGKTLSNLVPQARQAGADAVVVMAHEGIVNMRNEVADVQGIDHILASHDHLLLRHPTVVDTGHGGTVTMTEAGSHTKYVGHTRLLMDPQTRHVVSVQYRVVPVDRRSPSDPEAEAIVADYRKQFPLPQHLNTL